MTKEEWVQKELDKYPDLPAHNRSVLRSMKAREFDEWEREAFLLHSNNSRDDQ